MDKSFPATEGRSALVLCMPSIGRKNSFNASRHARDKLCHQRLACILPNFSHTILQHIERRTLRLLDLTRKDGPKVFDRVEIRRIGRKVDAPHALALQPALDDVAVELLVVVVQKVPFLVGVEELLRAREQIVLQNLLHQRRSMVRCSVDVRWGGGEAARAGASAAAMRRSMKVVEHCLEQDWCAQRAEGEEICSANNQAGRETFVQSFKSARGMR